MLEMLVSGDEGESVLSSQRGDPKVVSGDERACLFEFTAKSGVEESGLSIGAYTNPKN